MEWFGRFTRNPEERFFTWVLKSIGCAALLYTTDLNKNPKIPRQVAIKLEERPKPIKFAWLIRTRFPALWVSNLYLLRVNWFSGQWADLVLVLQHLNTLPSNEIRFWFLLARDPSWAPSPSLFPLGLNRKHSPRVTKGSFNWSTWSGIK